MATSQLNVLDAYYLTLTLLITIAYQLIGFSLAFSFKFDKLTDLMGGTNFALLAILTLALSSTNNHTPSPRQTLASICMIIWSLRLSGFLLFRILKTGKDDRFDDKRDKFFPFLGFWVFQMLWVWTVSLGVTILNSPAVQRYPQPRLGASDIIGLVMFLVGFVLEAVADVQKYRFRADAANKGMTCTVGLFRWSRHPNYFGEMLVQFGIWLVTVGPTIYGSVARGSGAAAAQVAAIVGPCLLATLLLFVSGITLQERPGGKKKFEADGPDGPAWRQWRDWTERTSILLPMPSAVWTRLPRIVKTTVGFEWPIYQFVPEKHADMDKVRSRQREEAEQS